MCISRNPYMSIRRWDRSANTTWIGTKRSALYRTYCTRTYVNEIQSEHESGRLNARGDREDGGMDRRRETVMAV